MMRHAPRRHRSQGFLRLPSGRGGAPAAWRAHQGAVRRAQRHEHVRSRLCRAIPCPVQGRGAALLGAIAWPEQGLASSVLVDETELPLDDEAADRLLLVHMLEWSEKSRALLRE